jgi:hypothetical protein
MTNKIIFMTLTTGVNVVKLALLLNKLEHLFLTSFLFRPMFSNKARACQSGAFYNATYKDYTPGIKCKPQTTINNLLRTNALAYFRAMSTMNKILFMTLPDQ